MDNVKVVLEFEKDFGTRLILEKDEVSCEDGGCCYIKHFPDTMRDRKLAESFARNLSKFLGVTKIERETDDAQYETKPSIECYSDERSVFSAMQGGD